MKHCDLCRFCLADVHSNRNSYYCTNQDSEYFGKDVWNLDKCDKHERFNPAPDMSFKDALEIIIMGPPGSYPSSFPKFGKEGEVSRPLICRTFTDNRQMLDYEEAHMRCFDELMRLKKEAGDFVDPEPEEEG